MKELTLEQSAIRALSSDVRVGILRSLSDKQKTLSDLAREMDLNKATIYKHINVLLNAELISRKERKGHKWIYYNLSWKGSSLLHPETSYVRLALPMSMALFAAGILSIFRYMTTLVERGGGAYASAGYTAPYLILGAACIVAFVGLLGIVLRKVKRDKR